MYLYLYVHAELRDFGVPSLPTKIFEVLGLGCSPRQLVKEVVAPVCGVTMLLLVVTIVIIASSS